ncbi:hypothetical protein Tco_1109697 [Tanacetum coccineum]|uniref:Uncharacterized protein n=1 Tax=Tanacetum coccineum TaxID=301880 RepID=A0ABQ5IGZ3_9ASTR
MYTPPSRVLVVEDSMPRGCEAAKLMLEPMLLECVIRGLGINALTLSDRHTTYHETLSDQVKMDDPNITMEEYIRLEEEKARRRAIVFNDTLTSEATLSCEPTVSCFNDLDFFKDFENEFPAIVYNNALTSKSNFLTEPTIRPWKQRNINKYWWRIYKSGDLEVLES